MWALQPVNGNIQAWDKNRFMSTETLMDLCVGEWNSKHCGILHCQHGFRATGTSDVITALLWRKIRALPCVYVCVCVFAQSYTDSSEKSTVLKLSDFSSNIGVVVVGLNVFWPVNEIKQSKSEEWCAKCSHKKKTRITTKTSIAIVQ